MTWEGYKIKLIKLTKRYVNARLCHLNTRWHKFQNSPIFILYLQTFQIPSPKEFCRILTTNYHPKYNSDDSVEIIIVDKLASAALELWNLSGDIRYINSVNNAKMNTCQWNKRE